MEDHAIKTSVTLDQNPQEIRMVSEAKRGEKLFYFIKNVTTKIFTMQIIPWLFYKNEML